MSLLLSVCRVGCSKTYPKCVHDLLVYKSLVNLKIRSFHLSPTSKDLMEFFDDKDNWGKPEVKTGRGWKIDELRIKSNSDLHKLWHVLLKERNMVLTMIAEYERECEPAPNPERVDKCEESMGHIEQVIRERDRAHNLLETGATGEPEQVYSLNTFAQPHYRNQQEFIIPEWMNTGFKHRYRPGSNAREFQTMYFNENYQDRMILARRYQAYRRRMVAKHHPDINATTVRLPESDFKE